LRKPKEGVTPVGNTPGETQPARFGCRNVQRKMERRLLISCGALPEIFSSAGLAEILG
jgi:hypothetical protein